MTTLTTAFAQGTAANRPTPSSSNKGFYYLCTDTNGGTLYQSTGSAWVQVAGSVSASGLGDPETTAGDMIYRDTTNTTNRLPMGNVTDGFAVITSAPYLAAPASAPTLTTATTGGSIGGTLAAPNSPTSTTVTVATTGGSIGAGIVQVQLTYVNAGGETVANTAYSTPSLSGSTNKLTITSPVAFGDATGWYAYVTAPGGSTFYRQQTAGSPTAIGTNLTLTSIGTSGAATPTTNTAWRTYKVYYTLANPQGETLPSPVATFLPTAATWTVYATNPPAQTGSGNQTTTGYYVFVDSSDGTGPHRQSFGDVGGNGVPIPHGTSWGSSGVGNVITSIPSIGGTYPATSTAGTATLGYRHREINVKSFGAAGDGVTDDTDAVQAAINAVGRGGRVYFPWGTYKINRNIGYTNNQRTHGQQYVFTGDGKDATMLWFHGCDFYDSGSTLSGTGDIIWNTTYNRIAMRDMSMLFEGMGTDHAETSGGHWLGKNTLTRLDNVNLYVVGSYPNNDTAIKLGVGSGPVGETALWTDVGLWAGNPNSQSGTWPYTSTGTGQPPTGITAGNYCMWFQIHYDTFNWVGGSWMTNILNTVAGSRFVRFDPVNDMVIDNISVFRSTSDPQIDWIWINNGSNDATVVLRGMQFPTNTSHDISFYGSNATCVLDACTLLTGKTLPLNIVNLNGATGTNVRYVNWNKIALQQGGTAAAGAALGTSPATPTVTAGSTASRGAVSCTLGTSPTTGIVTTVTFANPIGGTSATSNMPTLAPQLLITPTNAAAVSAGLYVSALTNTTFTVSCVTAPTGTLTFAWAVVD